MVGVYLSTVIGWYKRYSMEGMSGLKSKVCVRRYLSGWAPALAKEWQLRSVIVGENPKQLTLPFGLWSRWAVMRLVKVLFNIEMPIRTVGEYMLHLRYAPLQPMRRALEQSPFGVEQWLNDIYPTNAAGTKAEGAVVCWGVKRRWQKTGTGYAALHRPDRGPLWRHRASTPCPGDGFRHQQPGGARFEFAGAAMNTDLSIGFMERLIADSRQKVFLFLDSLKVHYASLVSAWLVEEGSNRSLLCSVLLARDQSQ